MSYTQETQLGVVKTLSSAFGLGVSPEMLAEVRLRPNTIEFDIFLRNENGAKYIDESTGEAAKATRSFEVAP
jgi:hypothetical protein